MLSDEFDAPLRLELRPSRYLYYYLILAHAAALAAVLFPLSLSDGVRVGMVFVVLASAGYQYYRYRVGIHTYDTWLWRDAIAWDHSATQRTWQMQRVVFLSSWLVVIHLQDHTRKRLYLSIVGDQLPMPLFRKFFLKLKFAANPRCQSDAAT